MQLPAANSHTINDLVPEVTDALQGRTDVSAIIPKYMRRAIQEITTNNPFEELRRTGPQFVLTVGQPSYPVSSFLNTGDDYTWPESMAIFVDIPTNTVVAPVDYKTPKAIETMIAPATQGLPSRFTRYGSNFLLGPNPNAAYTVFLRYQVRHPFPDATDSTSLLGTKLLLPDDWEEIIVYETAHRVAVVKRWNDQAVFLHQMLYGDPATPSRPGLYQARLLQVERDQRFNTRQLGIVVARYNAR